MSAREWKPGDVVLMTWPNGESQVIYRFLGGDDWDIPEWQSATEGCAYPDPDELRPLVVIDPEDREAVERLADLFFAALYPEMALTAGEDDKEAMQAALREFANPKPSIEEPTGLGAVVEDENSVRWIAIGPFKRPGATRWRQEYGAAKGAKAGYADISAVRILSEGVTP